MKFNHSQKLTNIPHRSRAKVRNSSLRANDNFRLRVVNANGPVAGLYTSAYTVDPDSNITGIGTGTYGYDALNRLNAENIGTATSYTYDLTDNRLTKVAGGTTTTTVPAASNKISAVGSASYAYDLAGDITSDGAKTYTWDAANRLTPVKAGSTTLGTYTYDYLGRRAKKVAGSTTTYYVYGPGPDGPGGLLYGEYSSTGGLVREYIYMDASPLAQVTAGSPETVAWLHVDHLGTPRYATNAAGAQVWSWTPDAFGTSAPTGTLTLNLRLPGQYADAESGLFYNWNRTYNPAIGRYLSPDPIGQAGGLNLFSYAGQSPVMNADPMGLYDALGLFFQGLIPASTAPFSQSPIGGSTQSQLEYAAKANEFRNAEAMLAGTAIGTNYPVRGLISEIESNVTRLKMSK